MNPEEVAFTSSPHPGMTGGNQVLQTTTVNEEQQYYEGADRSGEPCDCDIAEDFHVDNTTKLDPPGSCLQDPHTALSVASRVASTTVNDASRGDRTNTEQQEEEPCQEANDDGGLVVVPKNDSKEQQQEKTQVHKEELLYY
jgi:hypothetical protein